MLQSQLPSLDSGASGTHGDPEKWDDELSGSVSHFLRLHSKCGPRPGGGPAPASLSLHRKRGK